MSTMIGWQLHCVNKTCVPCTTVIVLNIFECRTACLAKFLCKAATYHQSTSNCDLFVDLSMYNGTMLLDMNIVTMIVTDGTRIPPESEVNWVINGDAETGPCQSGSGVTHPTGWSYSGTITQMYYGNVVGNQMLTDPGPSNRGNCHFYGGNSASTTMWQTHNMTNSINPLLIDSQKIWFDFSAWIGGYLDQDDNAQVSLTFLNQSNQNVGNSTILGPVLAVDRGNKTSLVFRQAIGPVPVGARTFTVKVTMTRASGVSDGGDIDSIVLFLYQ
ncbi:unnamed protein product [Adineta steineri]|uniref:Apple domain-containing protein n=1 Tax=Adineta steineri TaxID=433720 RepID=A0A814KDW9_9BILA|nr:unnamed protein product [Adineta steineri]CAF1081993.1 unnamed protein product [Adineta steineri]